MRAFVFDNMKIGIIIPKSCCLGSEACPRIKPTFTVNVRFPGALQMLRTFCTLLLVLTWNCTTKAQEVPMPQLSPGSARKIPTNAFSPADPRSPEMVSLTVAKGSPLQVALDQDCLLYTSPSPRDGLLS